MMVLTALVAWLAQKFESLRWQRKEFPLHHFVFMQTASHLPHEGNVEHFFLSPGASLTRI